ncbi:MAG TPA: M20 family metallopeptidase [Thermodesulfobacteriota bacterium]|nr:M20 family metallopeptidase [Thermodesulfobacteriota bacterium]
MGIPEKSKQQLLADLCDLIAINTSNPPGREAAAARLVIDRMTSIGGACSLQEFAPERANAECRFRFSSPEEGPCLVFNSHIDVVPEGNVRWRHPAFQPHIDAGRVYGRGACDAKGSVAAMMGGIRLALESGAKLKGELIFTAVAAEETGGLGTRHWVRQNPSDTRLRMGIVGEPTYLMPFIAHKGLSRRKVSVRGVSAHASVPAQGRNAIYPLARLALFIEDLNRRLSGKVDPLLGSPVVSANVIHGGIKDNVIPDYCELHMDRRRIPGEDNRQFDRELESWVREMSAGDPSFQCSIEILGADKEPVAISPDEPIVKIVLETIFEVTGRRETPQALIAATDMTFLVHDAGIPTVILGPGLGSHVVDESVEIAQLEEAATIYARLITRILGA